MKYLFTILMLLSINVFAAPPAPQWAEDSNGNRFLEILGINPGGNGGNGTLISLVNASITQGDCANKTALFLSSDNPDYNSLFSLVLAAKMSGKNIKVRYGGCSTNSGYPLIEQIYFE